MNCDTCKHSKHKNSINPYESDWSCKHMDECGNDDQFPKYEPQEQRNA